MKSHYNTVESLKAQKVIAPGDKIFICEKCSSYFSFKFLKMFILFRIPKRYILAVNENQLRLFRVKLNTEFTGDVIVYKKQDIKSIKFTNGMLYSNRVFVVKASKKRRYNILADNTYYTNLKFEELKTFIKNTY